MRVSDVSPALHQRIDDHPSLRVGSTSGALKCDSWLIDLDGVLVRENTVVPGAGGFLRQLTERQRRFLVLTNNSIFTPRDLAARLLHLGVEVPESAVWTSALATAEFVTAQHPQGTAYVVGEAGLTTALHEVGYVLTDRDPDFVVLGDTRTYSFEALTTAIRLIGKGARFIATNPDVTAPCRDGPLPATGSVAAMIATATGQNPYFVGKPNPMMIRFGLNRINAHSETAVMVGDRMDTDVVAGTEAGLQTLLVLTGSTSVEDLPRYPYRPNYVLPSIAEATNLLA